DDFLVLVLHVETPEAVGAEAPFPGHRPAAEETIEQRADIVAETHQRMAAFLDGQAGRVRAFAFFTILHDVGLHSLAHAFGHALAVAALLVAVWHDVSPFSFAGQDPAPQFLGAPDP